MFKWPTFFSSHRKHKPQASISPAQTFRRPPILDRRLLAQTSRPLPSLPSFPFLVPHALQPSPKKNTPKGLHNSAQGKDAFLFSKIKLRPPPWVNAPKETFLSPLFRGEREGRGVPLWVHQP